MAKLSFDNYRKNDIERNLRAVGVRPLDVMVTGVTGAGKSTTLNAFFQKCVAKVGDGVDPETMNLTEYSLNDYFRLWDTPGLGDGIEKDLFHKKRMIDLLYKTYSRCGEQYGFIDIALVIIEGSKRDLGSTYSLLNDVIVPNIQKERILVVINQADIAMKGRYWNRMTQAPETPLLQYLDEQALSIQRRVKEYTGISIKKPVCYSAEYGWNTKAVFDFIVDNMPLERRRIR